MDKTQGLIGGNVKYILAIDQGTTGSRAIVYDKKGKKVASAYQEFNQYFPVPGWVEHDPRQIWESVNASIQKVLKKISSEEIAAVGITNQRETTIIWDKETGEPIHNAVVWQCRRTSSRCDEIKKKKELARYILRKTGLPVDAYFSATKIEWILRNVPGARKKAKEGKLLFGTPDTWVLWKLTGGREHKTDYTNASRTMLFDIDKKEWDERLLRSFSVPRSMMPRVCSSSGVLGETVKIGKLREGIKISGMAGDQQAALFGQACFDPGTSKNTYGTGCFMLLNTGKKRPFSKHGLIVTLGCGAKGEPVYVLEGAIFIGGAAIQWLRDGLKIVESAPATEGMATSLKSNEGVYFVPALVGLGAPYWDHAARGAVFGITRGTKPEHFARAAIEAMCYQTCDVLNAMQKDSGLKVKNLRVDGGAVRSDFLCQFQADILGVEVVRPSIIEITSLGAAYLAGLAVGFWEHSEEIKKYWKAEKIFKPSMPDEKVKKYYDEWKTAVSRTLT